MPEIDYTPAALTLTGGAIEPEPRQFFYDPAELALTAGSFEIGLGLAELSTAIRLPRLQRQQRYFNPDGTPTPQMQIHWQTVVEMIENRFRAIEAVLRQQ